MDEDNSLAIVIFVMLAIGTIGCAIGVWYKMTFNREDGYEIV